jgi:hypothetical protein
LLDLGNSLGLSSYMFQISIMIHLIYPEQEARRTNTRVQVRQHPQLIVQSPKMQRPHQSHLDSSHRERFTHSDSDLSIFVNFNSSTFVCKELSRGNNTVSQTLTFSSSSNAHLFIISSAGSLSVTTVLFQP